MNLDFDSLMSKRIQIKFGRYYFLIRGNGVEEFAFNADDSANQWAVSGSKGRGPSAAGCAEYNLHKFKYYISPLVSDLEHVKSQTISVANKNDVYSAMAMCLERLILSTMLYKRPHELKTIHCKFGGSFGIDKKCVGRGRIGFLGFSPGEAKMFKDAGLSLDDLATYLNEYQGVRGDFNVHVTKFHNSNHPERGFKNEPNHVFTIVWTIHDRPLEFEIKEKKKAVKAVPAKRAVTKKKDTDDVAF